MSSTEVAMNPIMDQVEQLRHRSATTATATAELVTAAAGRRDALEDARDVFIDRLHRASDDYDATRALALLYGAINVVDALELAGPHLPDAGTSAPATGETPRG